MSQVQGPDRLQALLRWLSGLLVMAVVYVMGTETIAWSSGRSTSWGSGLGGLLGGAVALFLLPWAQRQRYGDDLWSQYRRALASGTLPPDADPAVWSPLLTDRVQMLRQGARIAYPMLAVIGVGWLILAINGRFGELWWLVGGALVVAVLLFIRNHLWIRRRLVGLWQQLPAIADDEPAA